MFLVLICGSVKLLFVLLLAFMSRRPVAEGESLARSFFMGNKLLGIQCTTILLSI